MLPHRQPRAMPTGSVCDTSLAAGYNFKALSCTPTYLNPSISQFLHYKLFMKSGGVTIIFVSYLY